MADSAGVDQNRLYATTDAKTWAEEFAKVCPDVDEGLMIGWFANAIETAKTIERAFTATHYLKAINRALHELGVPDETYPAPVANAVKILNDVRGSNGTS